MFSTASRHIRLVRGRERSSLWLLFFIPIGLGSLLFLFSLLSEFTASGPSDPLAVNPSTGLVSLPDLSTVFLGVGLALAAGMVMAAVYLWRRLGRASALAIVAGGMLLGLLAFLFRGVAGTGSVQAPLEATGLSPVLVASLVAVLLAIVLIALVVPRLLLPLLLLLGLLMALPGMFGLDFWGAEGSNSGMADGQGAAEPIGKAAPISTDPTAPPEGGARVDPQTASEPATAQSGQLGRDPDGAGRGIEEVEGRATANGGALFLENGLDVGLAQSGAVSHDVSLSPEGGHEPPDEAVFRVRDAHGVRYLRTVVADSYDGNRWVRQLPFESDVLGEGGSIPPPDIPGAQVNASRILALPMEGRQIGPGVLPISLYPTTLWEAGQFRVDREAWLVRVDRALDGYAWLNTTYQVADADLRTLAVASTPRYLALPDAVPDRVRRLAVEATAEAASPYDKAVALRDFLKSAYTYDFAYTNAPPDHEPTDWFLFEDRRGVCANFSNAFVVMARAVGLPARPVAGWAIAPMDGEQVVRANQAHQWAEVYFERAGWVTFDPTPAVSGPVGRADPSFVGEEGHQPVQGGGDGAGAGEGSGGPGGGGAGGSGGTGGGAGAGGPDGTAGGNADGGTGEVGEGDEDGAGPGADDAPGTDGGTPSAPVATVIEITGLPARVRKAYPAEVSGTVITVVGDPVDGMDVEVFINEEKVNGGELVGAGRVVGGSFTVEIVVPAESPVRERYQVIAHAVENASYLESWSDPEMGVYAGSQIEMNGPAQVPIGAEAKFSGRVTEEGGQPIAGGRVRIQVDGDALSPAETDLDGAFAFAHTFETAGHRIVVAEFEETEVFLGNRAQLEVLATVPTALRMDPPGRVKVGEPATVSGTLRTVAGEAIQGATVALRVDGQAVAQAGTDASGRFAAPLTVSVPGSPRLDVFYPGELPLLPSSDGAVLEAAVVTSMELRGPSRVVRGGTASFLGKVTAGVSGEPLADVALRIRGLSRQETVRTDAEGSFRFEWGLTDPGLASIDVTYNPGERYWPSSAVATVAVVVPTALSVGGGAVTLRGQPYRVEGGLRSADGEPIAGEPVQLRAGDRLLDTLTTGVDGRFAGEIALDGQDGVTTLTATFEGTEALAASQSGLSVAVGLPRMVFEEPEEAARGSRVPLRGMVHVAGTGVPGVEVTVVERDGEREAVAAVTGGEGRFTLSYPISQDTQPGVIRILIHADRFELVETVEVPVKIAPIITILPDARVRHGEQVEVRALLKDDAGAPVGGATLLGDDGSEAQTDELGIAHLALEPRGEEGDDALLVTVRFAGDNRLLTASQSAWMPVTPASFNWLLWVAMPASFAGLAGLGGFVGWRRQRRPAAQVAPIAVLPAAEAAIEEEKPAEPQVQPIATSIRTAAVLPAPDLPPVWGMGERVDVEGVLTMEGGAPLADMPVHVGVGDVDGTEPVKTGPDGRFAASWAANVIGSHSLASGFGGEHPYLPAHHRLEIRVVDFRAEVIRLYNGFSAASRSRVTIPTDATPREVEALLSRAGVIRDARALEQVIAMFEEADYSEHDVGRRHYEAMYRALQRVSRGEGD